MSSFGSIEQGFTSLTQLREARGLAEAGKYAAVVEYLRDKPPEDLDRSPTLALIYGTSRARLGEHTAGAAWITVALERAQEVGDRHIEARALNGLGAIHLETGCLDEAVGFFERALAVAQNEANHGMIGRCSNNLGIIEDMRGNRAKAIAAFSRALVAFEQAGTNRTDAVNANLAVVYGHMANFQGALEAANLAVTAARQQKDGALLAELRCVRAEVHLLIGDMRFARKDIEAALSTHRGINDVAGEASDLRVLGLTLRAEGSDGEAERVLRGAVTMGEALGKPYLAASAGRDLAELLHHNGRQEAARMVAAPAQARFAKLGAVQDAKLLEYIVDVK